MATEVRLVSLSLVACIGCDPAVAQMQALDPTTSTGGTTTGVPEPDATSTGAAASESTGVESTSAGEGTGGSGWTGVRGTVELGPFVTGSIVSITPLDPFGVPAGEPIWTEVIDDGGSFGPVDAPPGIALIEATGRFFDYVANETSNGAITLRSVVLIDDEPTTVYVNVAGHLGAATLLADLGAGGTFASARASAASRVRRALEAERPTYLYGCAQCVWSWELESSSFKATLRGPDNRANAWLLGLGAALLERAHAEDPLDANAALQTMLDDAATVSSACEGNTWFRAFAGSIEPEVSTRLTDYYAQLDIDASVPHLVHGLDQDGDCKLDIEDNCPTLENAYQLDADADGIGDVCECDFEGPDADGDFWPDACDSCVDTWNPGQEPRVFFDGNMDNDAWGDACDECPQVPGVGDVPSENCCDPREANTCTKTFDGSIGFYRCGPVGERFSCVGTMSQAGTSYGWPAYECWDWPCVEGWQTKPCTVGNDVECEGVEGATCIPWFADGDAPAGIEDLGMCAHAESGPCVGVPARECVTWASN